MYKCIMDLRVTRLIIIFSSPMLKGSSELSDCFLSSTHLSISFCLPVNYLKTFLTTSPEPHGQFQANLAQNILREAVCKNERPCPLSKGDAKKLLYCFFFLNLLKSHFVFRKALTFVEASLCGVDLRCNGKI